MTSRTYPLIFAACAAIAGCSDSTAAGSTLTLASQYHLRTTGGTAVPLVSDGDLTDSGRVTRLGGDTVRVDLFRHVPPTGGNPGIGVVSLGTWRATQTGSVIVLFPLIASTVDTATLSGNTLTLHAHQPARLDVYVAP